MRAAAAGCTEPNCIRILVNLAEPPHIGLHVHVEGGESLVEVLGQATAKVAGMLEPRTSCPVCTAFADKTEAVVDEGYGMRTYRPCGHTIHWEFATGRIDASTP